MKAPSLDDALELRRLLDSHQHTEKHIGYHILPERLNSILANTEHRNVYKFFERERFAFICKHIDFSGKRVLDIGCNVGYFLFGALDLGARSVTGYEGKLSCSSFLNQAIQRLSENDSFNLIDDYFDFSKHEGRFDISFLLNVVHHLGDDYGDRSLAKNVAKSAMIDQINGLSSQTSVLVFQMGFNWKGDRNLCLFEHGTKREMIDFIEDGTRENWETVAIGIAERGGDAVSYRPVSESNIHRDDSLGEFLNRPIFILRSRAFVSGDHSTNDHESGRRVG